MKNYSCRLSDDVMRGRQDEIKCESVGDKKKKKKVEFRKTTKQKSISGRCQIKTRGIEDLNQMISEP